MDGLLIVDKPSGPTSHDVVARVRRVLGERRIGHTGTLDPAATGVLPLVIGKATRLARFLSASEKTYDAVVRLGFATDTGDADGTAVGLRHDGPLPSLEEIKRALVGFRGTYQQQAPTFSAKKIGGRRSYRLARAGGSDTGPTPAAATVTASAVDIVSLDGDRLTLTITCSAGFYVRSLARDLGERLGVGAHLAALRRTHSGEFTRADAVPLETVEREPSVAARRVIPLARMLTNLSSVVLTAEGVRRATQGRDLGAGDTEKGVRPLFDGVSEKGPYPFFIRLLDPEGDLVGIAERATRPGLLHPFVVLR